MENQEKDQKVHLPVIDETDLLPTEKAHTSFSELTVHEECSWKHMLVYVKKLGNDKGNIHTAYGKMIHSNIESYLLNSVEPMQTEEQKVEEKQKFLEALKETELEYKDEEVEDYFQAAVRALSAFPEWFKRNYPDAEVVGVEIPLFEEVPELKNRFFKGYIDCVLKLPKKPRKGSKKPAEGHYYLVIDWKTTSWGWTREKKQDFAKLKQLAFYKHYLSQKYNVPYSDIKCSFVLVKRIVKPESEPFEIVPVSLGDGSITKALESLKKHLSILNKKLYLKNRNSCKYCQFKRTSDCT